MSYFRENIDKVRGYVPGFQPDGGNVVKLNTNENPYPPSAQVIEAVRLVSAEQLRRYPQPLGDDFRIVAAKVLGVEPGNIICTNGGDDLLTICMRAFCDERRAVAFATPTYSLYPVLAELQNCRTIEVPFGDDLSLPEQLAETEANLTIVCNPNAPTTSFIQPDELARLAEKISGVLLIDEAYVDFADDDCVRLVKDHDNVIILRSMSKGYSLAGIRFGFGIAAANMIETLMKVKDSYNVDVLAIAAAAAAMNDREYFRDNVEKIKEERAALTRMLRELGFTVADSQANFILAKCNGCIAREVYDKLVDRNIYVRYFDLSGLEDKLRITVGTAADNNLLVAALKEILAC